MHISQAKALLLSKYLSSKAPYITGPGILPKNVDTIISRPTPIPLIDFGIVFIKYPCITGLPIETKQKK